MSRKALIVGIDYYRSANPLYGCVSDAYAIQSALEHNSDGTRNFDTRLMIGTGEGQDVSRTNLRMAIRELFADDGEISLFYFAGHGFIDDVGGFLIASDTKDGDDGISLSELVNFANSSKVKNRIIILDSCHSGFAGKQSAVDKNISIASGVTILTASTESQYALEENGHGLFTSLFVDALNGGASNLVGDVTPGSIYSHIDQSLGAWDQRPLFKTNVSTFVSLKRTHAPIELSELRKIREYFSAPGEKFALDPSFEPTSDSCSDQNMEIFATLQKLVKLNLLTPVDEEHMYYAAMNSKSCRLTVLGEHYWRLIDRKRI